MYKVEEMKIKIKPKMPDKLFEYGSKPSQDIGDRCVRGGWCYVCVKIQKVGFFFYRTILEKSVFLEGEF